MQKKKMKNRNRRNNLHSILACMKIKKEYWEKVLEHMHI